MAVIVLLVGFLASTMGAICGIGGGILIKPILDTLQIASVDTISFMSGCTVLFMSCYSVVRGVFAGDSNVDFKIATPLALGALLGGISGKQLFDKVTSMADNPGIVGCIQAFGLAIITICTLCYVLNKRRIKTCCVQGVMPCTWIGFILGLMSSFLGIGGGPINLVVLFYFFSLSAKDAAQNSLFIIFVSQVASLATTLVTNTVPDCDLTCLGLMILGGIAGGVIGGKINKCIANKHVEVLFMGILCFIILLSCYNMWAFTGGTN